MTIKRSNINIFNRYNTAVLLVFIVITLVSLAIAFLRYRVDVKNYLANDLVILSSQAEVINRSLQKSEQTLNGMKQFAEYYLKFPNELNAKRPQLTQEEQQFYLHVESRDVLSSSRRLNGNITGVGNTALFSDEMWHEITMASALTPAFVAASQTNEDTTWFYYLSANSFINIYPWIGRNSWRYTENMLSEDIFMQIKNSATEKQEYIWSSPFIDTAGKGIKVSIGSAVYDTQKFVGALIFDIDLASLQSKLPENSSDESGYILMNPAGDILVHKKHAASQLSARKQWQDIVPDSLKGLTADALLSIDNSRLYQDWLIQKHQLSINDWYLIKYQPYQEFIAPLFNRFLFIFTLLFVGMGGLLGLVYIMAKRTFVTPATEFIHHIEYCAQGDPGKIKPTKDWRPWFTIVENIFGENRSLLQQLKDQNIELDLRVTEKTQALIERSEQHQRDYVLLRSVINAIPEVIVINDVLGNLIGCNASFEKFIGLPQEAMVGKKVTELVPVEIKNALIQLEQLAKNDANHASQKVVETKDATYELFVTQFQSEDAASFGTINILRDVSEQYATQSALEHAKNQAEYANKAKSQFLANMSHEIRTPINAIQGMMALLEKTRLNAFQSRYLLNAQSASSSLLHLIDELLDLSKIEAGKLHLDKKKTDLDAIIDMALQLNIMQAHSKKLPITVDIAENVPTSVITDKMRLVQVLSNLLNNAVKFTHEGQITVSVDVIAESDTNTLIRFKVIDTGIGIAKDKQAKLFDAFIQADDSMTREYGGSGLGLSICRQIVNFLEGEISIKSEENTGSEFSFVIPFKVLPNQEDEEFIKNVTVMSIASKLPKSLETTIQKFGWCYRACDDIEQLINLKSQEKYPWGTQTKVIVLIDAMYLESEEETVLNRLEKECTHVDLIGLCQPVMMQVSDKLVKQFAHSKIPYLVFEKPLYRYTLSRINKFLTPESTSDQKEQSLESGAITNSLDAKTEVDELQNVNSSPLSKLKILLVEDNLVNQMVAKELLISMGAIVDIAENGQVALDILMKEQYDVVLMDIQMPVMDGLTATKKIRAINRFKTLPIVAMTAHARNEDRDKSFEAGMNLHIAKPVNAKGLSEGILSVLNG